MKNLILLYISLATVSSCGSSSQKSRALSASVTSRQDFARTARNVVQRYISADTAGAGLSDSIDALLLPCEGDRATDGIAPVLRARIRGASNEEDTLLLVAEYEVLGAAQSWDTAEVGHQNWRFTKGLALEQDTMLVVQDSEGHARIVCGPYHGNHWGTSVMALLTSSMNDSSKLAWSTAVGEARRRWP